MKTSYIIAGGPFDGFFEKVGEDDMVITADKGYEYAKAENIKIDYAIGDFDSTDKPDFDKLIILNPIKDFTDTDAAIRFAIERGYENITIYGALGGREGHTVANIKTIFHYKNKDINIKLKSKNKEVFVINEKFTYDYKGKDFYVSIFSLTESSILDIRGLYYELDNYEMKNDDSLGVSNQTNKRDFEIDVKEGTLLVIFEDFSA